MKTLFTSLILLVLVLNVQGQTKTKPKTKSPVAKNASYIIGTWSMVPMPTGDGMSQDQTWTFTKTDFVMEDRPELKQKGMYKIMKEKGDTLFLKLYNQEGNWGTADKEQKITIDKKNSRIRIGWKEFRKKE